jgi:hypothetical protein
VQQLQIDELGRSRKTKSIIIYSDIESIASASLDSSRKMAQYFFDLLYNFTDCMCCFPSTPQLKINNRSFKLLRLLGEVSQSDLQTMLFRCYTSSTDIADSARVGFPTFTLFKIRRHQSSSP